MFSRSESSEKFKSLTKSNSSSAFTTFSCVLITSYYVIPGLKDSFYFDDWRGEWSYEKDLEAAMIESSICEVIPLSTLKEVSNVIC